MEAIERYTAVMPNPVTRTAAPVTTPTKPVDNTVMASPKQDVVAISAEELRRAKDEAAKKKQQELQSQQEMLREQLESANRQADAMMESAEKSAKCLTIASRIMAGDTVPPADHRYLAKNNSQLYAQAITLRTNRSDPRKYKRLSEEEQTDPAAKALAMHGQSDSPPAEGETAPTPPAAEGEAAAAAGSSD